MTQRKGLSFGALQPSKSGLVHKHIVKNSEIDGLSFLMDLDDGF